MDKVKRKVSEKKGKIYFFTNGEFIKIGFTSNSLDTRLKQLNTGSAFQLYSLGYIEGTLLKEKELHVKFAKLRVRFNGEWFKPEPELLNYINTYNQEPNTFVEVIEGRVIALMRLPKV